MSDLEDDIDVALWAAGALTPQEYERMRARLETIPALAALAEEWESALAPLASRVSAVAPPADLLSKIEARLDAGERLERASPVMRAMDGIWIDVSPGLRFKVLHRDLERRRQTILLEAEPGAVRAAHVHGHDEELGPGDFYFAPRGSRHSAETSCPRRGCRCLIVTGF